MSHTNHVGRFVVVGVGALVLSGAGIAVATSPPTDPPPDTGMAVDTVEGASSEPMSGAGPSDCPPIAAAPMTSEPMGSEPMGSEPMTSEPMGSEPMTSEPMGSAPMTSDAQSSGPFVQVAESADYGPVLVDADCRTLYVFANDTDGTPTCVDDCAANWPPALVTDGGVPPLADELDPSVFTVVDHPDGSQLKAGDWPLYTFAADMAPGDANGQGVGGVWWLVGPDGTPIEEGTAPTDGTAAEASAPGASMPTETTPMTTTG